MCINCSQNNCTDCTQETNICNQCQPEQVCDCAVKDLSTDCSIYNQDDIECDSIVVVAKNTILSDALANIVSWSCTKFSGIEKFFRIINTGTGAEIYSGTNLLGEKKLKTLLDSSLINIFESTDEITIAIDEIALTALIEPLQTTPNLAEVLLKGNETEEQAIFHGSTVDTYIGGDSLGLLEIPNDTRVNLSPLSLEFSNVNADLSYSIGKEGVSFFVNNNISTILKTNVLTTGIQSTILMPIMTSGQTKTLATTDDIIIVDGSETKITAGTNVSVTGIGTTAAPYVINSIALDQTVVLTQGGATTITGTYPNFTISSTDTNTTYSAGTGLALIGTVFSVENLQKVITYPIDFTGTNYTLTNADNNYEIIVDNGATAVTITVPSGLTPKIGVGFTQKGIGDVTYVASGTTINNPIGLKIKGQYYQTYLSQELATNLFYLGGNTKI